MNRLSHPSKSITIWFPCHMLKEHHDLSKLFIFLLIFHHFHTQRCHQFSRRLPPQNASPFCCCAASASWPWALAGPSSPGAGRGKTLGAPMLRPNKVRLRNCPGLRNYAWETISSDCATRIAQLCFRNSVVVFCNRLSLSCATDLVVLRNYFRCIEQLVSLFWATILISSTNYSYLG